MKPAPARVDPVEDAYRAALGAALIVEHAAPDVLRLAGASRLDLIHRMSTNDLAGLPPGVARQTVFTTPLARIVETAWVLTTVGEVLLVATPDRGRNLYDWLRGYIFFQDDVRLTVDPPEYRLWGLYGPAARLEAARAFPTAGEALPGHVVALEGGLAWGVEAPAGGGVRLLLGTAAAQRAEDAWSRGSSRREALQAYDVLRVEAGLPVPGAEITPDAIPLEVGLRPAVSFAKGCYIGQEIIARMESRGQLARRLAGVLLEGAASPGEEVRQAGRREGTLTSATCSPRLGWIALATVRPASLKTDGGRVSIGKEAVAGRLVDLPFPSRAAG